MGKETQDIESLDMYVLVIFAVVMTGQPEQPVAPITRGEVGYYNSREMCEADVNKQGMNFLAKIGKLEVALMASKCVLVKGPEGTPA